MTVDRTRTHRLLVGLFAGGLIFGGSVAAARPVPARATAGDPPAADCQPYGGGPCLLPFPNNLFTRPDPSSTTGLRVSLPAGAMPINSSGQRVSVAPYDRADGFSPGSAAILHVPGLDNAAAFARTGAAGVLDMASSLRENQPIVIIDEQTGRRQLIWSELDANANTPQTTDLLIHRGKDFVDGHTYVVALRNLRTAGGTRDRTRRSGSSGSGTIARSRRSERSQRTRYARIFAALARAGVAPLEPVRGMGLHGRVATEPDGAPAVDPQRRLRPARRPQARRRQGRGAGADLTRSPRRRRSPRSSGAVARHVRRPCYLIRCGTTATTGFHYSSSKPDAVPTQTRETSPSPRSNASSRARPATRPRPVSRSTAMGCSVTTRRSRTGGCRRSRSSTTSSSAGRTGGG